MRAETAYNVFQELSPGEKERFYRMCGMVPVEPKKPKRKQLISDTQATEYLIKKFHKTKQRNARR